MQRRNLAQRRVPRSTLSCLPRHLTPFLNSVQHSVCTRSVLRMLALPLCKADTGAQLNLASRVPCARMPPPMQMIESAAETEELAASVDDNGGLFFVPAFSGLLAPYWRADARGLFCGLTAYNSRAHVARAVLEATAFQAREDGSDCIDECAIDPYRCDNGRMCRLARVPLTVVEDGTNAVSGNSLVAASSVPPVRRPAPAP